MQLQLRHLLAFLVLVQSGGLLAADCLDFDVAKKHAIQRGIGHFRRSEDNQGKDYFMASGVGVRGTGAVSDPFGSLEQFLDTYAPGDRLILGAGTYQIGGEGRDGVNITGSNSVITAIIGQPGSKVVLDFSSLQGERNRYGVFLDGADCWYLENLEITGVGQAKPDSNSIGLLATDSEYVVLNSIVSHHNGGRGIQISGSSREVVIANSNSYCNFDDKTHKRKGDFLKGDNADGFGVVYGGDNSGNIQLVRNVAYRNSDDGFDLWKSSASVYFEGNLAVQNGYNCIDATPTGNGVGFKLGPGGESRIHELVGNHSLENRVRGFDQNGAQAKFVLIGNSAQGNGTASWPNSIFGFGGLSPYEFRFERDAVVSCYGNVTDAYVRPKCVERPIPGVSREAQFGRCIQKGASHHQIAQCLSINTLGGATTPTLDQ